MTELVAAMFGFVVGGFVFARFVYWIGCLWVAIDDYRIAAAYPHLRRKKQILLFVPLLLLHSGPWALAIALFIIFELFVSRRETWHFWFAAGFVAYVLFMCVLVLLWMRRKNRVPLRAPPSQPAKGVANP